MTIDLLSLVLDIRPLAQPDPVKLFLPAWWGRAAHALLLNVIRQFQPVLAESLHEPPDNADPENSAANRQALRPFTVSSLIGRFPAGVLDMERPYTLRLTAFRSDLSDILWQAAQSGPLAPGSTIELDHIPFQVERIQPTPEKPVPDSPWAAANTYTDLSASLLLAKNPAPRQVSLQFTSPTTFKSGGMHVPIPLPGLVIGSLLERWNAFAPITFPPEVKRYAEECLAISRYRLSSRVVPVKSRGLRMGAVGEITFTALNYDRYWMSVIGTLSSFALYSGVGAATSMGLGQCRAVAVSSEAENT